MKTERLRNPALAAILPIVLVPTLHFAGVWIWAGAHPIWSLKGSLIGLAIGLVAYLIAAVFAWRHPSKLTIVALGFVGTLIVATIVALNGKAGFVASYAEDGFAGRVWFYGYIAAAGGFAASLATIALMLLRLRPGAQY